MIKLGILGQPGCVLSFRHNFLFGIIWAKFGPEDQNFAKQEIMPETQNTPRLTRNAPFAHLGAPRGCHSVVLSVHMAKAGTMGACLGGKRPENGQTATEFGLARPNFNQSKALVRSTTAPAAAHACQMTIVPAPGNNYTGISMKD
jgi:hypothetical protein